MAVVLITLTLTLTLLVKATVLSLVLWAQLPGGKGVNAKDLFKLNSGRILES